MYEKKEHHEHHGGEHHHSGEHPHHHGHQEHKIGGSEHRHHDKHHHHHHHHHRMGERQETYPWRESHEGHSSAGHHEYGSESVDLNLREQDDFSRSSFEIDFGDF